MTVFIDDMYRYPMGRFRGMKMSHMIADTDEELHAMARAIGLRRAWFQDDHYDVSLALRAKALALGAHEISLKECAAMCMLRRWGFPMGDPATAKARMIAAYKASK